MIDTIQKENLPENDLVEVYHHVDGICDRIPTTSSSITEYINAPEYTVRYKDKQVI